MASLVKLGHRSGSSGDAEWYGLIRGADITQRIIASQLPAEWSKEISN